MEPDSDSKQVKDMGDIKLLGYTEKNVENWERCVCTAVKAVKLTNLFQRAGFKSSLVRGIMGSAREVVEKGTPEP